MATAEIIEVDFVLTGTDRQLVFICPFGEEFGFGAFELVHLDHVGLRVFLNDGIDVGPECLIASGVVAVGMSVDDRGYRLIGNALDPIENRLSPSRQFRIDKDNSAIRYEDR